MKKIILMALCWPLCSYPLYAQKEKTKNNSREIIIIKSSSWPRQSLDTIVTHKQAGREAYAICNR